MRQPHNLNLDMSLGLDVEHVFLESAEPVVAERSRDVRIGPTFRFASPLHRRETELAFSTDHRLTVRARRRGRPLRMYVVDLRFVDAEAAAGRPLAWRGWRVAAALTAFGAFGYWLALRVLEARWQQLGLQVSLVLVTAALGVGLLGLYRSRANVELRSVNGRARLAEVAGHAVDADPSSSFVEELSRRVEAARRQIAQSKQHFLRDEMREHHRLWSIGVLSDSDYEASKRRILAAHD